MIVCDASAVLDVLLRVGAASDLDTLFFDSDETLHAPHFLDVEVAQVLRRYAHAGIVAPDRCRVALLDLADLPVTRYPHEFLVGRVWELRGNLTAYDAVYVALAEALDARFVTRDRRIAAAPGHRARVILV